jgi:homoserine kinase type II
LRSGFPAGRTVELCWPTVAVLTSISEDDVRSLLTAYGLGAPLAWEGLAAGSVNSNFAIDAEAGRTFLRLYEEQDFAGAKRETAMLGRLARAGVPTPAPLRRLDAELVSEVRGKPAALFPWKDGSMRCQAGVTDEDAWRVGEALARVHVAGAGESVGEGRFGYDSLIGRLDRIEASGDARFVALVPDLRASLARVHRARDPALPHGLIHGDLFRDNVLWAEDGRLAALLDFESACHGAYVYDLMVLLLSWCFGDDLAPTLATALRSGYESVRRLSEAEKRALHAEGEFAALRFTITRITDYAMRTDAAGPRVIKDWRRFMKRFEKLEALGPAGLQQLLGLTNG